MRIVNQRDAASGEADRARGPLWAPLLTVVALSCVAIASTSTARAQETDSIKGATVRSKTTPGANANSSDVASANSKSAIDSQTTKSDISTKAVPPVHDAPQFFVNDNRLTYAYLFNGTDPGITAKTAKQVFAFTHFDVWAYGTNYANLQLLKSDKSDPAIPCADFTRPATTGCAGETEFYGVIRNTLGFNQLFNTKAFSVGPLQNVSFELGVNAGTQNSFFGEADRQLYAGLQFAFDLPYHGYFNVAPMAFKNFTHEGYVQCGYIPAPCLTDGNVTYNTTWAVETNYYMDLGFLPPSLQFFAISGRIGLYGPRGYESAPLVGTEKVVEINSEPIRLTLDAGKAAWGPKHSHDVDIWVAWKYWQNKYGLDAKNSAVCTILARGSCTEDSVYTGLTVKF